VEEAADGLLQFNGLQFGLQLVLHFLFLLLFLEQEGVLALLLFEHFSNKYKRIMEGATI
jgi:hypothetical protein